MYHKCVVYEPDGNKVDFHVDGERLFEGLTVDATAQVVARVHGPCKWDLLCVA